MDIVRIRILNSSLEMFRSGYSNMSSPLNNYLLEPTSLGVSNNPSAPPLVGTLPPPTSRRVTQWWGTISLTYNDSPRFEFSRIF